MGLRRVRRINDVAVLPWEGEGIAAVVRRGEGPRAANTAAAGGGVPLIVLDVMAALARW
jgi:hypothetical protein